MTDHNNMPEPSLWRQEPDEIILLAIGKLAEEAGELASRAARCIIHGAESRDPETNRSNFEELQDEIADVRGLSALVITVLGLDESEINKRAGIKQRHKKEWLSLISAEHKKELP